MKEVTIDCAAITNSKDFHQALASDLSFPEWYGNNLDALHDCLSSICEDTRLTLLHFGDLGRFSMGFRLVLEDAENENPHLFVYLV